MGPWNCSAQTADLLCAEISRTLCGWHCLTSVKPAAPSVDILVNLHHYRYAESAYCLVHLLAAAAHCVQKYHHNTQVAPVAVTSSRMISTMTQWLKFDCRAAGHKMAEDPPTVCGILPPPSAALCTDLMLWVCCCFQGGLGAGPSGGGELGPAVRCLGSARPTTGENTETISACPASLCLQ